MITTLILKPYFNEGLVLQIGRYLCVIVFRGITYHSSVIAYLCRGAKPFKQLKLFLKGSTWVYLTADLNDTREMAEIMNLIGIAAESCHIFQAQVIIVSVCGRDSL